MSRLPKTSRYPRCCSWKTRAVAHRAGLRSSLGSVPLKREAIPARSPGCLWPKPHHANLVARASSFYVVPGITVVTAVSSRGTLMLGGFPFGSSGSRHSDQVRGDAALQWDILKKSGIDQFAWFDRYPMDGEQDLGPLNQMMSEADWLVDGLLGTGLSRPVEGPLFSVITAMNHSGKPILALDLPSGLDTDTGRALGVAVRATATATFVAPKLGFSSPEASQYIGKVGVIDIGLPGKLLKPFQER